MGVHIRIYISYICLYFIYDRDTCSTSCQFPACHLYTIVTPPPLMFRLNLHSSLELLQNSDSLKSTKSIPFKNQRIVHCDPPENTIKAELIRLSSHSRELLKHTLRIFVVLVVFPAWKVLIFWVLNGNRHSTNVLQTSLNVDVLFEFLLQNFSIPFDGSCLTRVVSIFGKTLVF